MVQSFGSTKVFSVISCLQFGQRTGSLNMNSYGPRLPATSAKEPVERNLCLIWKAVMVPVFLTLLCQTLDKCVLELQSFVELLHADAFIPAVRSNIIDIGERAIDAVGRNPSIPEIQAIGSSCAHHGHDDDTREHLFR